MTHIKRHHALVFFLVAGFIIAASFSLSQKAAASGSQTFTSSGTFIVPAYSTLTVTVNGAGGGGGGGAGGSTYMAIGGACVSANIGGSGSGGGNGGTTSLGSSVVVSGGGGGGGPAGTNDGPVGNGSSGIASGGDTNTTGGGAGGGGGGSVGSGSLSVSFGNGGSGGSGGRAVKAWASGSGGAPTAGQGVTVTVGMGGSGGAGGTAAPVDTLNTAYPDMLVCGGFSNNGSSGSAGSNGSVTITWTSPASCSFNGETVNSGSSVTAYQSSTVAFGSSCVSQTRTCTDGTLSGTYQYASCTAQQGTSITGYAWSDTIGWVSLDGSGYGLSVAQNGDISGYAWSDNIGWVSANSGDLTGCPSGACKAKLSGNNMQGWLKALSADGNGWDGWISLSGASPSYGVTKNADGTFTGYAWGSDVVGWVDFSLARTGYQVCTPTTAYTCTGVGNNTIRKTEVSAACQTTVTDLTPACESPFFFCSVGSPSCLPQTFPSVIFNQTSDLTGHLKVTPLLMKSGSTAKVYWDVSNVSNCTVTPSNGSAWTIIGTIGNNWTSTPGSTGQQSAPITQRTTFTLTCTALSGEPFAPETQVVNVVPVFQER